MPFFNGLSFNNPRKLLCRSVRDTRAKGNNSLEKSTRRGPLKRYSIRNRSDGSPFLPTKKVKKRKMRTRRFSHDLEKRVPPLPREYLVSFFFPFTFRAAQQPRVGATDFLRRATGCRAREGSVVRSREKKKKRARPRHAKFYGRDW